MRRDLSSRAFINFHRWMHSSNPHLKVKKKKKKLLFQFPLIFLSSFLFHRLLTEFYISASSTNFVVSFVNCRSLFFLSIFTCIIVFVSWPSQTLTVVYSSVSFPSIVVNSICFHSCSFIIFSYSIACIFDVVFSFPFLFFLCFLVLPFLLPVSCCFRRKQNLCGG